ncbi:hypothetical protein MKW94_016513 [Papaver nudicaule]|uniref:F-box/LRR-repeat protein 12 n=1 Tax=Papaver nudicaule TaxID=74823 RepID=A0AA41UXJ6_PAPNU|nr:hypothetical protein [Papaver nudicaule]
MKNYSCKNLATSIMNLPDDCLVLILQLLDRPIDRNSFGLTCHRWLRIQNSSRRKLWFNHYHHPLAKVSPHSYSFRLTKLLTRFQQLNFLSLSHCTELPDSALSQLQSFGSNIQTLYLECCLAITDYGFSLMASGCPHLTSISLYKCSISDIGLEALAKSCSSLQKVNLSWCGITDTGIISLGKSCSSLQKLNLSNCVSVSDRGIRYLSQACRQLSSITVSYCEKITGVGFHGFSETLAFVEAVCCKLEPEGIQAIVSGGGLEYLDLSNLDLLVARLDKIGFAKNLRVLNFRNCRDVRNAVVIKISKGCPLLQEWNLAHCHEIDLDGWTAIGSNCHNLEILHVNMCFNLRDAGLQALLFNGCRRLSKLYMSNHYSQISHFTIEQLKCRRSDVKIRDKEVQGTKHKNIF